MTAKADEAALAAHAAAIAFLGEHRWDEITRRECFVAGASWQRAKLASVLQAARTVELALRGLSGSTELLMADLLRDARKLDGEGVEER